MMAHLKYDSVPHNQKNFLEKASKRRGFVEAYDELEAEYAFVTKCYLLEQVRDLPKK